MHSHAEHTTKVNDEPRNETWILFANIQEKYYQKLKCHHRIQLQNQSFVQSTLMIHFM